MKIKKPLHPGKHTTLGIKREIGRTKAKYIPTNSYLRQSSHNWNSSTYHTINNTLLIQLYQNHRRYIYIAMSYFCIILNCTPQEEQLSLIVPSLLISVSVLTSCCCGRVALLTGARGDKLFGNGLLVFYFDGGYIPLVSVGALAFRSAGCALMCVCTTK